MRTLSLKKELNGEQDEQHDCKHPGIGMWKLQ